jgi:hypothetical protein
MLRCHGRSVGVMGARGRLLACCLLSAFALSGCGAGRHDQASGLQPVKEGWVRYHNGLGWSLSYPEGMHLHSEGPFAPVVGVPGGPSLVTTVTVANFTGGRSVTGQVGSVVPGRNRPLPKDGAVLQISGGEGGELLQIPDARLPLRLADFRPAPWPDLWRKNGVPPFVSHTLDAGGQRYTVQLWIGPRAPARMRPVLARIISSIRFDHLRSDTLHGSVAVAQKASQYPVGSFTPLHIKGEACSGSEETCHAGTEPIYLVHAPGRSQYYTHLDTEERCLPASSCVPFGTFYAIGWKDKTGYPSACHMRLDFRHKQFYCANIRARWDVGGRPITVPDHGYPTALSFDVAKIAFDGHIIIGGKFTAEIPKRVVRALWPPAFPTCSSADYRARVGALGATGSLVGMTGVVSHRSTSCQLQTRLIFAVQKRVGRTWMAITMVGNPAHADLTGLLKPGASIARDWAWWNYCGPHRHFRFQVTSGGHIATTSISPPHCNSAGRGPGRLTRLPPKPR